MGAGNPPVVLLGGHENALSCARRFVAAGITTLVVNAEGSPALRSRGVVPVPLGAPLEIDDLAGWLDDEAERLAGAVLLPLSDRALTVVTDGYERLSRSYRPALLDPAVVRTMLDKQATLELAAVADVPAPRQWLPTADGIDHLLGDLTYPLILKPRHGYELIALTGSKYLRADDEQQLLAHLPVAEQLPSGYVLNKFIVGDDGQLSSYYAIRSPEGETLVEFTKRVDRRCPPNKGGATFHHLTDLPDTAELGRRFFDAAGVVGLANVEFKADVRTGELKLIECNHRITAAAEVMHRNGIDLARAVYDQAIGQRPAPVTGSTGGYLWYPVRDLISFRMSGDRPTGWLRRLPTRPATPYWSWSDPAPALAQWRQAGRQWWRGKRQRAKSTDSTKSTTASTAEVPAGTEEASTERAATEG